MNLYVNCDPQEPILAFQNPRIWTSLDDINSDNYWTKPLHQRARDEYTPKFQGLMGYLVKYLEEEGMETMKRHIEATVAENNPSSLEDGNLLLSVLELLRQLVTFGFFSLVELANLTHLLVDCMVGHKFVPTVPTKSPLSPRGSFVSDSKRPRYQTSTPQEKGQDQLW